MKTQINILKKTGKVLVAILFLLAIIPGCSEFETETVNDELKENQLKSKVVREGTVQLEGFTRFAFYKKVEGEFIEAIDPATGELVNVDGYDFNFLPCEAELVFGNGQSFTLTTAEIADFGMGPFVYRVVTFNGKMTPSGQLKFNWPETWIEFDVPNTMSVIDQISAHTGMKLSGPGVNKSTVCYKGSYDKEMFFADMHLNGLQKQPGQLPFLAEMVEGPVLVNFMIDLHVVD